MPSETVTFAVMCFNQAPFVRHAVEAAFAQTHEPLQIILSDDRSTDGSFEIMRELADAYRGPHRVVLRQNSANVGLIAHVNEIFRAAEGELIVISASDDISLPERTTRLHAEYHRRGRPALLHSKAFVMEEDGTLTDAVEPSPLLRRDIRVEDAYDALSTYLGATGAWSRRLFDRYGPITNSKTYEDLVLGFRAALEGGGAFVDEVLVQYRVAPGSISYAIRHHPLRVAELALNTLEQRRRDVVTRDGPSSPLGHRIDRSIFEWQIKRIRRGGKGSMAALMARHPLLFLRRMVAVALDRAGKATEKRG